jgi:predicted nuclease of predicted toxin-antitoxin system
MPRRLLLDESVPIGLRGILTAFEVKAAPEMGWAGISNGKLLDLAEAAGFEMMVTADSNIRAQQRLIGRKISLVVLTTNHWNTIKADPDAVVAACDRVGEGTYTVVNLARPPRRRRSPPASP